MDLRLSDRARADLDEIWEYLADVRSAETADRVTLRITDTFDLLLTYPEAGRRREGIAPGIRSVAVKPYVILYRLAPGIVEIVRGFHGARSIRHIFPPPEEPR